MGIEILNFFIPRNFLEGIKNANGAWVEEVDEVAEVASKEWRNALTQLTEK